MSSASSGLLAFAEDPEAFVAIGPDQERVLTDRYCVTFTPGEHFWSTSVQRVRFGAGGVEAGLAEVRGLMVARGRGAAAWTVGPSATPPKVLDALLALGLESESDEGSVILVLTEPPRVRPTPFEVRVVSTYDEHLASIEVGSAGFGFPDADAMDERRRTRQTFDSERAGAHSARLVAFDGDRSVATGRGWFSPHGLSLGGGATLPADRRRGAASALIAEAWREAVRRGTPALVTHGGTMAAPILERMGFRSAGRVRHLIDRIGM